MNSHSKLILAVATFCAVRFAFALSPGDTAGRIFATGSGAWVMCAASMACGVAAANGVRPVSIS